MKTATPFRQQLTAAAAAVATTFTIVWALAQAAYPQAPTIELAARSHVRG
jgi:hypothetical protein